MTYLLGRCAFIALSFVVFGTCAPARGQSYPSKNITIIVPLGAGTGIDLLVRLYANKLSQVLGKSVIVDNKPGAATMLGAAAVATAPADGHTLGVLTSVAMSINPTLYRRISYKPQEDFVPISLYVKSPFILVVNPGLAAKSVPEFIKLAKESKPLLNYASVGAGTLQHLSMEFAKKRFGFEATHVPYRATGQSVTDLMAGHVTASFVDAGSVIPLIKDGKLRALAVSSSIRLPLMSDVPPFSEASGASDYEAVSWHILVAPAKTPKEIVDRLHVEMKRIMVMPDIQGKILELGLIPNDTPSIEGMRTYVKSEHEKWGALVKQLGLEGSQ